MSKKVVGIEYNVWRITAVGSDNVRVNFLVVGEFVRDALSNAEILLKNWYNYPYKVFGIENLGIAHKPYDKWENLYEAMGADA